MRLSRDKADQRSWHRVYSLLWPRVMSTTYRALGGLKDRAEDASQEVFYRLVRYADFDRLRSADEFLGYVRVICQNVASDFLQELAEGTVSLDEGPENLHEERFTPPNPEQLAITEETRQQLTASLLPDEVVLLQLLTEGREDQEIALKLGWSYAKTGVRIHRLRARIRKLLKMK